MDDLMMILYLAAFFFSVFLTICFVNACYALIAIKKMLKKKWGM